MASLGGDGGWFDDHVRGRDRVRGLEEDLQFVVGEWQLLQPGGSPIPGGVRNLVSWIRKETQERIAALEEKARRLYGDANSFAASILRLAASPPLTIEQALTPTPEGKERHEHIADMVLARFAELERDLDAARRGMRITPDWLVTPDYVLERFEESDELKRRLTAAKKNLDAVACRECGHLHRATETCYECGFDSSAEGGN